MFIDLALNLAFLVALTVVSGFVAARWPVGTKAGASAQGVLFGGAAVLGLLRPLVLSPGLIFDGRSVVISLCALFFGPWAAVPAAMMTLATRIWIGGMGLPTGALVILSSAAIGLIFRARRGSSASPPSTSALYVFGLVVHTTMVGMFFAMPWDVAVSTLQRVGLPVIALYPLATVLAGSILADQQAKRESAIALASSVENFERTTRITFNALWAFDPRTGSLWWNTAFYDVFGHARSDETRTLTFWARCIHPEDIGRVQASFERALAGPATEWTAEYRFTRADGTFAVVEDRALISRDRQGEVIAVHGAMQDISSRRLAEADLRLQSAALNAAANGVVITDRDGTIVWVNPAFSALTGYTRDEAIGRNPRDLVKSGAHEEAFYAEMWRTLVGGQVWTGELTNRRKNGTLYVEQQTITPVRDAAGAITHFVGIKWDLTEQRELEARYLQTQKMESIGRLAGGVAHDFNNLLTVINGTAELMAMELADDDPRRADVAQIREAGARGAALTRQLLAFSRKTPIVPVVLDLHEVVDEMRGMLGRLLGERLTLDLAPHAPAARVRADRAQLEMVVLNLVVNARDAMPDGGTIEIAVRNATPEETSLLVTAATSPGSFVRLSVTDSGVGMDEATQAQIFEPFFTTKSEGRGTGLGLATVYAVVTQNGGHVRVESRAGQGSTFEVYLPAVDEVTRTSGEVGTDHGETESRSGTVLVVEDDDALRELAARILRTAGHEVLTAASSEEALELASARSGPIDVLLTDIVLPGLDGHDLAAFLTRRRTNLRVVYMSGYADRESIRRDVAAAKVPFLSKPYTPEQLIEVVHDQCRSR